MDRGVTVWYDHEGDYLEVLFEQKEACFRETDNDAVMETVDPEGLVIGVSLLNVSQNPSESLVSALLRDEAA